MATPKTTPTTIPPIAAPDSPEEEEEAVAEALAGDTVTVEAGLADGVGVVNDEGVATGFRSTVVVCPGNVAQPNPTEPPS